MDFFFNSFDDIQVNNKVFNSKTNNFYIKIILIDFAICEWQYFLIFNISLFLIEYFQIKLDLRNR